jgi:hypothetical protein
MRRISPRVRRELIRRPCCNASPKRWRGGVIAQVNRNGGWRKKSPSNLCFDRVTHSEAIQFLYHLRLYGAKFGLENTFKLVALTGNPPEKLRFIQVAGTSGKGSTSAMLEGIYGVAGLRTGLFQGAQP